MQNTARTFLIAATVIFGLGMVPALGAAMMSPMMFDAPGSEKNQMLRVLFLSVITLPLVIPVSLAGAWLSYHWSAYRLAMAVTLLPLINVAVFAVAISLVGSFSGKTG